jgi:hypothetical protein
MFKSLKHSSQFLILVIPGVVEKIQIPNLKILMLSNLMLSTCTEEARGIYITAGASSHGGTRGDV